MNTDIMFPCSLCERMFSSTHGLARHITAAHADPSSLVDGGVAGQQGREGAPPSRRGGRTARPRTTGPYTCADCDRSFTTPRGISRHCEAKDHTPGPVVETEGLAPAPQRSSIPRSSMRFQAQGSGSGAPSHGCLECGRSFMTANGLRRHQEAKGHEGVVDASTHVCPICDKSFTSARGLARHQGALGHKEGASIQVFVCSCGRQLGSLHSLSRHQTALGHTGTLADGEAPDMAMAASTAAAADNGGPYVCHACEKEFASARGLSRHMRVTGHVDEPEGGAAYACGTCERVFTSAHGLQRHHDAVGHSGCTTFSDRDSGIQCPDCYRKFASQPALDAHIDEKHPPVDEHDDVAQVDPVLDTAVIA